MVGFHQGETGATEINRAAVLGPDGHLLGVYNKFHPVVVEGEAFVQEETPLAFPADFGTFGVTICFDNHYVDVPRDVVAAGARLIAAPVWVWHRMGTVQHAEMVLRAVENRVSYVRADWGWGSSIIRPDGTVVVQAPDVTQATPALLVADVPMGPAGAPFTAWGWAFPYVFVLGLGVRLAAQVWTLPGLRARRDGPAGPAAASGT